MVSVILIVAILAAVAIPRLSRTAFDEAQLYDETLSALRYAQRTAVAQQRNVCVTFSGGNQLTLTYAASYGLGQACGPGLPPPGGSGATYQVTGPGAASYLAASSFSFNLLGVASIGQTITLSGGKSITVVADTGYVH
jgi:MSHA pilin protein MshC